MGNFKLVKCNNSNCDFWQNKNCLYGGTAEIKPNANQEGQCKAYESYCKEDDYLREVNAAYWAEESEMTDGTHPSQILERVRNELDKTGVTGDITFMDYGISSSRVIVSVNGSVYGIFDYEDNLFESTPEECLNNILEANGFGLYNNE